MVRKNSDTIQTSITMQQYAQRQSVQDTQEGKLGATECESGNVEVQWKNIKE